MGPILDLSRTDQGMWELREGGSGEPSRMGRSEGDIERRRMLLCAVTRVITKSKSTCHSVGPVGISCLISPLPPPQAPSLRSTIQAASVVERPPCPTLIISTQSHFQGWRIHYAQKAWSLKSITHPQNVFISQNVIYILK